MGILIIFGFLLVGGYLLMNSETGKNIVSTIGEQAQNVSDFAVSLVAQFEKFSATAYKDIAGYLTIGYGHKILPGENIPPQITQEQAAALLAQDIDIAASAVDLNVTVPISENQRSALISLAYNIGTTAFVNSTLLRKLNAGDITGSATEFDKWVHAGGKVSNGLIARREAEKILFLT